MDLSSLVPLRTLTSGRRISVFNQMRKDAVEMGLAHIVTRIDLALAHDRQTREYDNRWASPTRRSLYTPEVREIYGYVNAGLISIRDIARAQVRGLPPSSPMAMDSDAMLDDLFPAGARAITGLSYVEHVAACEVIVNKLETRWPATVTLLGLSHRVAFLAEYTRKYRTEISLHRNLTFATVRKFRTRGQHNLRALAVVILAEFVDIDDPAQVAARNRLLRPLNEQIDEVRTAARLRRSRSNEDTATDANADNATNADADANGNAVADADMDAVPDTDTDAVATTDAAIDADGAADADADAVADADADDQTDAVASIDADAAIDAVADTDDAIDAVTALDAGDHRAQTGGHGSDPPIRLDRASDARPADGRDPPFVPRGVENTA